MKKKTTRNPKTNPTVEEVTEAFHKRGMKVEYRLSEPITMPVRIPGDPEPVLMLLGESERMANHGNNWANAEIPNPIAANRAHELAWGYAVAAAWLRCKLKGELLPESKEKK